MNFFSPKYASFVTGDHMHMLLSVMKTRVSCIFYAPNFEVEGAYWFGSVRAVSQSISQSVSL